MSRKPSGGRSTRNTCDKLWRDLIKDRAGWTCQACGRRWPTDAGLAFQAAHIYGRGAAATRTDENNGLALCADPCHRRFDDRGDPFRKELLERLGMPDREFEMGRKAREWTTKRLRSFDWVAELARLKELDVEGHTDE